MDKLTYSTDSTAAVPGAALSLARRYLAATGNSTAGYFSGGEITSWTTIDKITYSNDTRAALPSTGLSYGRSGPGATGNSTAGYFGGGGTSPNPYTTTIDKVDYASDTAAVLTGTGLNVARRYLAASGEGDHESPSHFPLDNESTQVLRDHTSKVSYHH
jgi:hypothetical protein